MAGYRDEDKVKICDVGDVLYKVRKGALDIRKITITKVWQMSMGHYVYKDNYSTSYFSHTLRKSCFKTRGDAERELHRQELVTKKRKLLKEYERKLNGELGLIDHFIIK